MIKKKIRLQAAHLIIYISSRIKQTLKILDKYIIGKYLGTFFFCIALIIVILIVFDVSEKLDDFLGKKAPINEIVLKYYLNFIPYFINLFSPLFIFISVIFFTAQMASRVEIIAILNAGVSYKRLLRPYMFASTIVAVLSWVLGNFIIPNANVTRLAFENKYIRVPYRLETRNIHRQIRPGEFIYFERYDNIDKQGYLFTLEKIENKKLVFKISADIAKWDSVKTVRRLENYAIRRINGLSETLQTGSYMDTTFGFRHEEFARRMNYIEAMDYNQLHAFIKEQELRGSEAVKFSYIELYRRTSYPFATFILTVIGVSIASRKVRGGIGLQLVAGVLLSFTYILFMQISTTFATNSNFPPLLAVWIPNFFYALISIYFLRTAQK